MTCCPEHPLLRESRAHALAGRQPPTGEGQVELLPHGRSRDEAPGPEEGKDHGPEHRAAALIDQPKSAHLLISSYAVKLFSVRLPGLVGIGLYRSRILFWGIELRFVSSSIRSES
jgi:hypothetical protein